MCVYVCVCEVVGGGGKEGLCLKLVWSDQVRPVRLVISLQHTASESGIGSISLVWHRSCSLGVVEPGGCPEAYALSPPASERECLFFLRRVWKHSRLCVTLEVCTHTLEGKTPTRV